VTGSRPGPYRVVDNRLLYRGEDLLSNGPLFQLELFAKVLNAAKPRDPDIAPTVLALINMTRGTKYDLGPRLLERGAPISIATPQKLRMVFP
jgi:hypothetical protein